MSSPLFQQPARGQPGGPGRRRGPAGCAGVVLVFALLVAARLPAAGLMEAGGDPEADLPTAVFILTDPTGAAVRINGDFVPETTPLLLRRELGPGTELAFYREGFLPERIVLEDGLRRGEVVRELSPRTGFGPGTYVVENAAGVVRMLPAYPHDGVLQALHVVWPVLAAASIGLGVVELFEPTLDIFPFSPISLGGLSAAVGVAVAAFSLEADKTQYLERREPVAEVDRPDEAAATELYAQAEDLLSVGRIADAGAVYARILAEYSDTTVLPRAAYRLGRVHQITGLRDLSIAHLQLVTDLYPTAETYDKARKSLADLYVAEGRLEDAIAELDRMVFLDPLFSVEEIDRLRRDLESRQ